MITFLQSTVLCSPAHLTHTESSSSSWYDRKVDNWHIMVYLSYGGSNLTMQCRSFEMLYMLLLLELDCSSMLNRGSAFFGSTLQNVTNICNLVALLMHISQYYLKSNKFFRLIGVVVCALLLNQVYNYCIIFSRCWLSFDLIII